MVNNANERFFVQSHVKAEQGIRDLAPAQALELAGADPDHTERDLFVAIDRQEHPRRAMAVQVMTEAAACPSKPLDRARA